MEDSVIINYIKHKNQKGLELLIERYGGLIVSIVRKHLHGFEDAQEECIDDVLLSIWNSIKMFDERRNTFKNWVGAISKYKSIDFKRKLLKKPKEDDIDNYTFENSSSIDEDLMHKELQTEIMSVLDSLPVQDRQVISKYYLEDKDVPEIAKEMLLKPAVIYNKLSRGRKKLRNLFGKMHYL